MALAGLREKEAAKAYTKAVRDADVSGIALGEYHADYSMKNYTFDRGSR